MMKASRRARTASALPAGQSRNPFPAATPVSPFAIFIGIFNPLLDTGTVAVVSGIPVSAGLISLLSILLKFTLTISAALLLIATTSFPGVCHALRRLGFPSLFISQLLFLYRYIFLLMEEAMRIIRARDMRSFGRRGTGMKVFMRLIGTLFIRTVNRAERIYYAMLSRGFQGDIPSPVNPPEGCRFHTRCPLAFERCRLEEPKELKLSETHRVCCHLVEEQGSKYN